MTVNEMTVKAADRFHAGIAVTAWPAMALTAGF